MIPAHLDLKNPKYNILKNKSNINIVRQKALDYGIKDIYISTNKNKKFMVLNPTTKKMVHFGSIDYEDHTFHNDNLRRQNYRKRAQNILGNWKNDKYSPNNLSLNILW